MGTPKKPLPERDSAWAAIIKSLPLRVRERAFYFSACLLFAFVMFLAWRAPAVAGGGIGLLALVKGVWPR